MQDYFKLKVAVAAAAFVATSVGLCAAAEKPTMVVVHKMSGIPWVNMMAEGVKKAGEDFGIDASLVGPTSADPAMQVKLIEDVLAQKVNVLGLDPLDVNVAAPLLKRAREAGVKIVTLEGPDQDGRDWDVQMVETVAFGEISMKRLADSMGGKGEYVVIVGGLTTPSHKLWADASVAYQETNYPEMRQATERFGMAESTEDTQKTVLDIMKAHPKVKGFLIYGSPGPIGAGNALRQLKRTDVSVVGTCTPGQAQALIKGGFVKECTLWNPWDSGYAMVAVGRMMLDGKDNVSKADIPGVGSAVFDSANKSVLLNMLIEVTKDNVDSLVAKGL